MMRKAAERNRVLEAVWIFLAVIVFGLVIIIRIRLLGIPLERDEGEYAYVGNPFAERYWPNWGVQVTQFLSAHSRRAAAVVDPSTNCVNPFENLPVFVATEWKP